MIRVTDSIVLHDGEVKERFVRSVGTGGQNPDKEATAVELRMDIGRSSLPADVKERILASAGRHVTKEGVLIVVSREYSSQLRNREAARRMLVALVRSAASPAKRRVATEPSPAARESRLASKERKGAAKKLRRKGRDDDQPR